MYETTGYERMTDAEFWAEVRGLLSMDRVDTGSLADYVHEEAERRDPELARLRRERDAIFRAAVERAAAETPFMDLLDASEPNDAENAQATALWASYSARFHVLAGT